MTLDGHHRRKTLFAITILLLLLPMSQADDKTIVPKERGKEVVEAVVDRIRKAKIFAEDFSFLRRIAYVESKDGMDPATYRDGYCGGIWQVDKIAFEETQKPESHPGLTAKYDAIKAAFKIDGKDLDWLKVVWDDLKKPLYAGLAARLYLSIVEEKIPEDLDKQAEYWKKYYNTELGLGKPEDFIIAIEALEPRSRSPSGIPPSSQNPTLVESQNPSHDPTPFQWQYPSQSQTPFQLRNTSHDPTPLPSQHSSQNPTPARRTDIPSVSPDSQGTPVVTIVPTITPFVVTPLPTPDPASADPSTPTGPAKELPPAYATTLIAGGKGKEIVENVVGFIRAAQVGPDVIFPDDFDFLRRIAYVESKDGTDPLTYRNNYSGGIWQVSEEAFKATKNTEKFTDLKKIHEMIMACFKIKWSEVEWVDLQKPFYSGLAARMYLFTFKPGIPRDMVKQAEYWKTYYHPNGLADEFITEIDKLEGITKSPSPPPPTPGPPTPVWFQTIASQYNGSDLKICGKRQNISPQNLTKCNKKVDKTCFFGLQQCLDLPFIGEVQEVDGNGFLYPETRCKCSGPKANRTWKCFAFPCP